MAGVRAGAPGQGGERAPNSQKKVAPLREKKRGHEAPLDQTPPQLVANFFEK